MTRTKGNIIFTALLVVPFVAGSVFGALAFPRTEIETKTIVETEYIEKPVEVIKYVEVEKPVEVIKYIEIEKPVQEEPEASTAAYELSDEERRIVECVVMGEAGGESYKGQMLVAQCILNGCIKEGIQPSKLVTKYQYSGWNNAPSEEVKQAVSDVFDHGKSVTDEAILYFYAPQWCYSSWHEAQRYVLTEGGHKFFADW